MAEEKINVEKISQNYLIEPADLYSNSEKASTSFISMDLPEAQNINLSQAASDFLKNINIQKNIVPTEVLNAKPQTENIQSIKELENLKKQINNTINPAIKNLYGSVSSLANKSPDPKGFTETRPTFNGSKYFFDDELVKVSQKVSWA
jgi:hypothetical protein